MPTAIGEAFVAVRPDTTGFAAATEAGVTNAAKKAAIAFAAAWGAMKVGDFLASSFDEATESIKVGKQTEAVIKSQGGAAGVTAKHVNDLANSMSNKAGIDDEVIQSGENMLLTFRGIRNETGKNNDIFDQASQATLDMAVAMKGANGGQVDLKGTSILLGKALNDPLTGMTALQRVGVRLTDEQKDQVAAHMAVGDTLGAQKIILGEVTREFGGSAAAQATAADKAGVAWGNLKESIGKALMPAVKKLSELITPLLDYMASHQGVLTAAAGIIGGVLVAAFAAWAINAAAAAAATIAAAAPILAIVAAAALIIAAAVLVWQNWDQIWNWIKDHPAYAVIIAILAWPIAMFILIVGALKILWENWDEIWGWIKQAATDAKDWIVQAFNDVIDFFSNLPGNILSALGDLGGLLIDAGRNVLTGMWNGLNNGWNAVRDFVTGIPGAVLGAIGDTGSILYNAGKSVLQGFIDGAKSILGGVKDFFGGIADDLTSWKGPPEKDAKLLIPAGQLIMDSFIKGAASRMGAVESFFRGVGPTLDINATATGTGAAQSSPAGNALGGSPLNGGLHIENAWFGDRNVVSDLDFWAKTQAAFT